MASWPADVPHYQYAMLLATPAQLVDAGAQAWIQRFTYCSEFQVAPFPGAFDDQPAIWLEVARIIKAELAAVADYQRKRNG